MGPTKRGQYGNFRNLPNLYLGDWGLFGVFLSPRFFGKEIFLVWGFFFVGWAWGLIFRFCSDWVKKDVFRCIVSGLHLIKYAFGIIFALRATRNQWKRKSRNPSTLSKNKAINAHFNKNYCSGLSKRNISENHETKIWLK